MSTAAHGSRRAVAPVAIDHAPAPRRALIRWSLGGAAALEWEIHEGPAPRARALFRDSAGQRQLDHHITAVEFIDDPASGLVHVRVASRDADLLRASIDPSRGVVYARTALIERLAIPGGRYEVAEGRLERGA